MGLYESIYHFSCQLATLMDLLSINVELKQNQSAEKSWMSINTSLEMVHAYILVSRAKTVNFSFFSWEICFDLSCYTDETDKPFRLHIILNFCLFELKSDEKIFVGVLEKN